MHWTTLSRQCVTQQTSERRKEVWKRRCQFLSLAKLVEKQNTIKYLWIHRQQKKKASENGIPKSYEINIKTFSWRCGEMMILKTQRSFREREYPSGGMFMFRCAKWFTVYLFFLGVFSWHKIQTGTLNLEVTFFLCTWNFAQSPGKYYLSILKFLLTCPSMLGSSP